MEASGAARVNPVLTLKALIAVIFVLIGLQYLGLLQVQDTSRFWRQSQASTRPSSLIYIDSLATNCLQNPAAVAAAAAGSGSYHCFLNSIAHSLMLSNTEGQLESQDHEVDGGKHESPEVTNATTGTNTKTAHDATTSAPQKLCPLIPPGLHGPIKVTTQLDEVPSVAEMEARFATVLSRGGRSRPADCESRHKVAVIVPYRDRSDHLRTLLFNLHSLLPRQQLDYGIYVVEQHGDEPFNRAMLFNVGAAEALKQYDYQCFVFHDVDLMPEDDRNIYSCPVQPRHMSVAIDTFMYQLPYDGIFGGVSAMKLEHFRQVNGFSNKYWGWGGEDDDMGDRLVSKKLYISRYPANIARYKMLSHTKNKVNPDRFKILYSGAKRMDSDGYNSLVYKRVQLRKYKLYTWVLVDLPHLKK